MFGGKNKKSNRVRGLSKGKRHRNLSKSRKNSKNAINMMGDLEDIYTFNNNTPSIKKGFVGGSSGGFKSQRYTRKQKGKYRGGSFFGNILSPIYYNAHSFINGINGLPQPVNPNVFKGQLPNTHIPVRKY